MRVTPVALTSALLCLGGCRASEEVQEQTPAHPPPAVKEEGSRTLRFESRTDTVSVLHQPFNDSSGSASREPAIRFMVQIGAFKDPQLATGVQTRARERYHLPVLNDYNILVGLYQIRIGFFETRDAANDFKARMMKAFPEDYKDAWVVQLKR